MILDSPAESFSFRHEDSLVFHKFTSDVDGMLSTISVEYDLHHSSFDHQHSKVSSLEQSRRIPYPHAQERFNRRYERLYEEDLNERSSDRVRSSLQVNRSVDSHPLTRDITINNIASTLAQQRLAEKSQDKQPNLRTQPPAMKDLNTTNSQEDDLPPLASSAQIEHPPPPTPGITPAHPLILANPDLHVPSELPHYPSITDRPTQASGIARVSTDLNRSAVESADQSRDLADRPAVPPTTGVAQPGAADAPTQLGPPGAHQTVTLNQALDNMANLDQETHNQGDVIEVPNKQLETSTEKNDPLSEIGQNPNPSQEETFQPRNTRSDASAKSLTTQEKEFISKLVHHVNNFESQLVSIYLDPLVAFNKTSCMFEPHYDLATNLNRLYLTTMMSSPKFTNILEIDQPAFVTLIQKHLSKYRQDGDKKKNIENIMTTS